MTAVSTTLPQLAQKHVDVFVLLDRSGSMNSRMEGALKAINAYVADLASHPATRNAAVSLFSFDVGPLGPVRDNERAVLWRPVLPDEVRPRGFTALFDAVRDVSGVIETMPSGGKIVLLIQTDGLENASIKTTKEEARNCIARLQERGVQILFLGADFDVFTDAQTVGVAYSSTIVVSGAAGLHKVFSAVARETRAFASGAVACMAFSTANREAARARDQCDTSDRFGSTEGQLAPPTVGSPSQRTPANLRSPARTYGRDDELGERPR